MQSRGLALCLALLIGTIGCGSPGGAAPMPVIQAVAPRGPVNVNEALVDRTIGLSGLVQPYRVIAIQLGILGELQGVMEADRAGTAPRPGTPRSNFDEQAWKVTMVGAQAAACDPGSCSDRFTYVEAYLSQDLRWVWGISMRPLVPGDPLIPSGG